MSGKKKNRNKVKRTGTGPQGQTAPLAEKAAEVILDGEEITNGNGSHVEHEDYVTAPQEDGMVVEVEQSGVEAVVDVGTNGKSSDVHTNDDATAGQDASTAASGADSDAHDSENHTSGAQESADSVVEENHASETAASVVDPIHPHSEASHDSSVLLHDSSVEITEAPAKIHSRQSSSSSSKSAKSGKSANGDHEAHQHDSAPVVPQDEPTPTSTDHHTHDEDSHQSSEPQVEVELTTSSISSAVRAAILADSSDDKEEETPSHSRISSSITEHTPADTDSSTRFNRRDDATSATTASTRRSATAAAASETTESSRSETRRRPISRVSSSSSSSSASLEDIKHEPLASSSSVSAGPRSSFKPLEPFSYNTSTSDDEDDEETKKATDRALERRAKAKARAGTDKVEEELLDARETIQSLKKRLAKSEAETEAARDETTGVREEAGLAKLELEALRKKHTDAVVFREESESDARKWRQRAEILQGELELVKFTEKKLAETAKALREAKDLLESERVTRDDLEAALKAAAHDREELIHAHQRELASAKRAQEVTQAAADAQLLDEREKASEAIRFVKSKLKAQIRELELHLEDKRDNDGESRTEKRRLEREIRKLEEKIELEASERAKEARSSESSKRQLKLLKDRVNKLTTDKLDLETLVLQEKRKFDALNADFDRASATIRALQAQVEEHHYLAAAKAPRASKDLHSASSSEASSHARRSSALADAE